MTATLLARRMMDGLSDTARGELHETLAELSQGGHADLVALFRGLLEGHEMGAALGLPEGTVALLYAQAHARFNSGHVTDALMLFQTLTVLAPQVKDHWLGLGICLRQGGSFPSARLAFATAQEIAPDCAATTHHMAELSLAEGNMAEAARLVAAFAALPESGLKQRMAAEARRLAAVLAARGAG